MCAGGREGGGKRGRWGERKRERGKKGRPRVQTQKSTDITKTLVSICLETEEIAKQHNKWHCCWPLRHLPLTMPNGTPSLMLNSADPNQTTFHLRNHTYMLDTLLLVSHWVSQCSAKPPVTSRWDVHVNKPNINVLENHQSQHTEIYIHVNTPFSISPQGIDPLLYTSLSGHMTYCASLVPSPCRRPGNEATIVLTHMHDIMFSI